MTLTTKCHVATICFATIEDRDRIGALKGNHISHVECLKAWLARCAGYPLYQRTDFAKPLYDDHVDNTLQDKDGEETATNYSTCLHVFFYPWPHTNLEGARAKTVSPCPRSSKAWMRKNFPTDPLPPTTAIFMVASWALAYSAYNVFNADGYTCRS